MWTKPDYTFFVVVVDLCYSCEKHHDIYDILLLAFRLNINYFWFFMVCLWGRKVELWTPEAYSFLPFPPFPSLLLPSLPPPIFLFCFLNGCSKTNKPLAAYVLDLSDILYSSSKSKKVLLINRFTVYVEEQFIVFHLVEPLNQQR